MDRTESRPPDHEPAPAAVSPQVFADLRRHNEWRARLLDAREAKRERTRRIERVLLVRRERRATRQPAGQG